MVAAGVGTAGLRRNTPTDTVTQSATATGTATPFLSTGNTPPHQPQITMKKRSLAGSFAIGVFVIALICILLAFATPNWLVSDYRITGAKLEKLGLWVHCFRSLADPLDDYQRRFFVGCRWVYDPFTAGYDKIRGFLLPPFMIATQLFFTLCFIGVLVSTILVLIFFLCCGPDQERFMQLVRGISYILLGSGLCGLLAVLIFAVFGNTDKWMPEHANNFFGWSFVMGIIGSVACCIAAALFLTEYNIQHKKREKLRESNARFEMEQETKA